MSQLDNDTFKLIRSDESDETRKEQHASESYSGSTSGTGTDSDSDSTGSSASGSSRAEAKARKPETDSDLHEHAEDKMRGGGTKGERTAARDATVSPKAAKDAAATKAKLPNGYNTDETASDSDESNSDNSDSDSHDGADEEDAVSNAAMDESGGVTDTTHNTTNNTTASSTTTTTTTTTTSTDKNTSNTEGEEYEEDDFNDGEMGKVIGKSSSSQVAAKEAPTAASRSLSNSSGAKVSNDFDHGAQAEEDDDEDDDDEADDNDDDDASESAETTKSSAAQSSADDDDDDEDEDEDASPSASSSHKSEDDEDEENDYHPKRATRQVRKPPPEAVKRIVKKKKRKQNWDSDESDASDQEESDGSAPPPPKRKAPPKKSNARQQQRVKRNRKQNYFSDDSGDDSKRFGTRRAAAAVSYKEASEDPTDSEDLVGVEYDESQAEAAAAAAEEEEKCETIERILAQRLGKKGCTGNQTTIYAIEDSGVDPNTAGVADEKDTENAEVQYLIKWKGWSYIHCTWESEDTLREQKAKGMKKLENFVKREQDIELWRSRAGPEDIDYFECQLELQNDLLKSYNNVDRIIARNEKEAGNCEYLCKWQSLPYAESTWEDATLVLRKWKRCVEQYEERESSKCTPSRHCKVLKYRPKFYKIKTQPEFLADSLILRDYQMDGLNWLLHSWSKENSVILADEMGLGKTIQTICFLYTLFKVHHLYGPYLCVVPLSTMTAWQREFILWAPDMNVVTYLGDVKSREMIRQCEWLFDGSKRLKFNCILTTYEIVLKDKLFLGTLQWAALLVDEAHRLKNDDSLLYKSLKEFETNHRLLITGTPLQNSLKELWALLHFIMPEKFATWEDFEKEHENAAEKGYAKLHQQLEPYILRRVKKDVEKSLPAKVEQILRVEMTSQQKQYYKLILTKNFDALRKGKKGSTSTFLNIVIELKKCCNHAALICPSEYDLNGMLQEEALQTLLKGSGKLVLLDKLLCRLKETGHRVLIFSQMVRMLDILADYLQKRHFPFQRLDGSIKGEMRRQALDHFNAEGSQDFCFLLSTRAGGLGINLATADTVIIFDSDWNPQNDLQAQARAHRIGQKNQVNIYRLVTARSVEEQIVERAKQKMVLDHLVIQRMDTTGRTVLDKSGGASSNTTPFNKDDLSAILKFGAEELFKDEQENDDELVCDIDEILRRAETRNEDPEMPADDLLSAFKVASIAAFEEEPGEQTKDNDASMAADEEDTKDWDEIIPADYRKIVEDQERAKEMEDLYLPPRRKTVAANQADTPSKRGSKKGQKADDSEADSEYEGGSDGTDEDGRPKRRGRPAMKEKITGFTDAELRRFIKSYKKFPAPLLRLEAIACDAELQEKPLAELKRIGELLHDRCVQFLEEHKDELSPKNNVVVNADENSTKQKRTRATFSIKLGGVSFNAKTLLSCEEELQPLNEIMPGTPSERLSWQLNIKTRPANFDTEWGAEEDSKLLCGIYQYGIGSWEQMKMDPSLKLTEKILFNDVRKPQAKHLQSRAEYLLKIIKKNVELKKGIQNKQRRQRKPREAKSGSVNATGASGAPETAKATARLLSESHGEDGTLTADVEQRGGMERKSRSNKESGAKVDGDDHDGVAGSGAHESGANAAAKKKKKKAGAKEGGKAGKATTKKTGAAADAANKPMHFTANNEPRALEVLGDLDPGIFNECKERMRPVKKSLKALDRPDTTLSNQDQQKHFRESVLQIGKHIDSCLATYKDAETQREWRSNLWYFVSKFTEFDANRLFKFFRRASRQRHDSSGSTEQGGKGTASGSGNASATATQTPTKKAKGESHERQQENGTKADDKDKSGKKKKKDREKDKDKDPDKDKDKEKEKAERHKERSELYGALGGSGSSSSMDRSKRIGMSAEASMKRKRDENDMGGSSGAGSAAASSSAAAGGSGVGSSAGAGNAPYKRMNMDSGRRNDERKKHHRDDYYDAPNNRRGALSATAATSSSSSSRVMHTGGGNMRAMPGGSSASATAYGGASAAEGRVGPPAFGEGGERWGRERYNASDYQRDRYDSYSNRSGSSTSSSAGGGYHRDRDRDRRPDKRRYIPPLYAAHYMHPPNYAPCLPNGILPPVGLPHMGYRSDPRYPPGGDWPRDSRMDYPPDYRRLEYERRQQT